VPASPVRHAIVNVNLSARQFLDPDLVGSVDALLRGQRVDPAKLTLEITESTLLEDPATAALTIERLRDLGLKVCIDDFGTGYSSLGYLSQYRFDMLKIDRTFVRKMDQDSSKKEIVKAVIGLSHSLGMTVVAEGVERQSELALLEALGCEHAQGFLFAQPMVDHEFERYFLGSNSRCSVDSCSVASGRGDGDEREPKG
jgi:EAL domain-containing protein (putative c-di-GMP-specific phosphodiesterase class I)